MSKEDFAEEILQNCAEPMAIFEKLDNITEKMFAQFGHKSFTIIQKYIKHTKIDKFEESNFSVEQRIQIYSILGKNIDEGLIREGMKLNGYY